MKSIVMFLMLAVLYGCGTVRYRIEKPTDGRRVSTAIQWDVVELHFNKLWQDTAIKVWDNAWH